MERLIIYLIGLMMQISSSGNSDFRDFNCPTCERYFKIENYCERLSLFEKSYKNGSIDSECLFRIASDISNKTNTSSSLSVGFPGAYYANDSLFTNDIRLWEKELKCK